MAWIGVITNAGTELLSQWAGGGVLNINSAKTGIGTVSEANLRIQTAVSGEKQTVSIVSSTATESLRKVKIQVPSHTESYTLKQIGLFANINSGSNVLLALFQNDSGVAIPSQATSPDFVYTFFANVAMANTGTLTLTIDPNAYVSNSTFTAHTGNVANPHSVTYDQTGAAAEEHTHLKEDITDFSHNHSALDISSGILPISRGGNGNADGRGVSLEYTTSVPSSANSNGIKIAVLSSEPVNKYAGWLYLITG